MTTPTRAIHPDKETTMTFNRALLALLLFISLLPAAADTVENGPASGASALKNGLLAVASGYYDYILVVGGEKMREITGWRATDFVATMRTLCRALQDAYQYPVDIEFTANFTSPTDYRINLLQCRPFQVKIGGEGTVVTPPTGVATTGTDAAMAPIKASGVPSHRDGRAKMSIAANRSGRSRRVPRNRTRSWRSSVRTISWSRAFSVP